MVSFVRFDGALNVDTTESQTNLVQCPRIHFIPCICFLALISRLPIFCPHHFSLSLHPLKLITTMLPLFTSISSFLNSCLIPHGSKPIFSPLFFFFSAIFIPAEPVPILTLHTSVLIFIYQTYHISLFPTPHSYLRCWNLEAGTCIVYTWIVYSGSSIFISARVK